MNAEEYIVKHWIPKQVWKNLLSEKHQKRFKDCVSFLPKEGVFLDVGCATGHSTHHLLANHNADGGRGRWEGMDFSRTAVANARKDFRQMRQGVSVNPSEDIRYLFRYVPTFAELPSLGMFTGVVCSEVIEHVEDDQGLVDALLAITLDTLVITTPNIHVVDPGHLRVYTSQMLSTLFREVEHEIHSIGKFWYAVACKEKSDG